ncbi:MAG: hypothetical protein JO257_32760 [Deltaproteobacteria bacterium]|nr:hypothetical protein [Deltaproteobacteria bacterium]
MRIAWALVVVGCSSSPSQMAMPDAPPAGCQDGVAGTQHGLSIDVSGEQRFYWLHVPASVHCTAPAPLLVDFHGTAGGDAPEEAYQTHALIAFADAHGVIVARPRSRSSLFNGAPIYRWDENAGDLDKNRAFAKQLVGALEQQYTIDPARVYASGFSSGSNMTAQFLIDPSSPFKGIAPIAGGRWTTDALPALANGPRIYMSTGYRDYLWPTARDLIDQVTAAGLPADALTVRHTGGGHDLYAWHFDELWQWLDGRRGFGDGAIAAPWTTETLPSPADINALAFDGTTLVAAGAHGRTWRHGVSGWTLDLDRGTADYTALCFGASVGAVGGDYTVVPRAGSAWGADMMIPDYGQQLGAGWANAAACRDDGTLAVVGYWSAAIRTGTTWSKLDPQTMFGFAGQMAGAAAAPGGATIVAGYYDYLGRAAHGSATAAPVDHPLAPEWWNAVTEAGGHFWVVGDGGAMMTSADDGVTWAAQTSGTTENLYAVAFADAQHGVAVGRRGTVIVTADGGATWTARPLGRDVYLGAAAIDATTITVAGEGGLVASSAR